MKRDDKPQNDDVMEQLKTLLEKDSGRNWRFGLFMRTETGRLLVRFVIFSTLFSIFFFLKIFSDFRVVLIALALFFLVEVVRLLRKGKAG